MKSILPGATLGMLGGGQLGRMSMLAGRHLGYRFHLFEPSSQSAAACVADSTVEAAYQNSPALKSFGQSVDVTTLEFENIPYDSVCYLESESPVRPGPEVLRICQNRRREKEFLRSHNLPCADFRVVRDHIDLQEAVEALGTPCVLKTADFGYDGKGQLKIESTEGLDYQSIWRGLGMSHAVVEAWVDFQMECSVIVARNGLGDHAAYPVAENLHRNHILHQSIVPARVAPKIQQECVELALAIADAIECIGLLAVELFITKSGGVLVNEMAPRPHNSGHWTMNGCQTSQFEQHIRAVCGLPLGSTEIVMPSVMVNLLGDVWSSGQPDWVSLLNDHQTHLHLYDKGEPRPGRKMGHFTVLDNDLFEALRIADALFDGITSKD